MLGDKDLPKTGLVGQIFFGEVVDNNDPLKLGRVKVRLSFYEDADVSLIPWAVILRDVTFGGGQGNGNFIVPTIGSYVAVQHANGDPHMPICIGEINTKPMTDVDVDYPNSYGTIDPNGNMMVENMTAKTYIFKHGGKVTFTNEGELIIENTGNTSITINGNVTANVSGTSNITCPTTNVTGDVNITGNVTVSGNVTATGEVKGKGVHLSTHTHTVPQSPSGTQESQSPTAGS